MMYLVMTMKPAFFYLQDIEMNAIILSAQFWPSFREEKITLPAQLQSSLDAYTQQYEMLKGNRTLVWKPHLGGLDCVI